MTDGEIKDVTDTIFSQDITTNGNNRQIPFANCGFQGDISTTVTEGAQIILEPGLVSYEKQDPNYYCVVQWWASGEKVMFVECESDPHMSAYHEIYCHYSKNSLFLVK